MDTADQDATRANLESALSASQWSKDEPDARGGGGSSTSSNISSSTKGTRADPRSQRGQGGNGSAAPPSWAEKVLGKPSCTWPMMHLHAIAMRGECFSTKKGSKPLSMFMQTS